MNADWAVGAVEVHVFSRASVAEAACHKAVCNLYLL